MPVPLKPVKPESPCSPVGLLSVVVTGMLDEKVVWVPLMVVVMMVGTSVTMVVKPLAPTELGVMTPVLAASWPVSVA